MGSGIVQRQHQNPTCSGITFDLPDIVAPAGAALWITLASDQLDFGSLLTGAEVELWLCQSDGAGAELSRKEYMADRLAWMRDSFRILSQTSPWKQDDIAQKRRQSKAADELLAVVEDILRVDPKEPTAVAYSRLDPAAKHLRRSTSNRYRLREFRSGHFNNSSSWTN